jgi:hypothetical protein
MRPRVAVRDCAHDLVSSLAQALAVDAGLEPAVYVDPTCGCSDLLVSLVRQPRLPSGQAARHDQTRAGTDGIHRAAIRRGPHVSR